MKLTGKIIAALALPEGKTEFVAWDDVVPGLGVRVRPSSKAWRIQYRLSDGQQRSESLGDVGKIDLDMARRIAKRRFAQAQLGQDPVGERRAASQARAARELTVGKVVERYFAAKAGRMSASSRRSSQRYLQVYARRLHPLPFDAIKRADVASLISDLGRERGQASAYGLRKNLSALWSWAMREGLTESGNIVVGTNTPTINRPRSRVLDDDELKLIWAACDRLDDDFSRVCKLLLFSGCRREEIGGLLWQELNLETGKMVLSASRTKNRKQHELILPELALEILRAQPRSDRPWVFGKRGAGLTGWSFSKMRLDKTVAEIAGRPLPQWGLHDLRRTCATRLGELGVTPHVIEAVLGHSKSVLHGTYNLAAYTKEKTQALSLWAEKLLSIVEGRESKVVSLPQRA